MTASQQTAQQLMAHTGVVQSSDIGSNHFTNTNQTMGINRNLPHRDTAKKMNDEESQMSGQSRKSDEAMVGRDMKSANFFQMSGIPKFGKNWLDNFIPDEEMQNTFMTSEIVRNVLLLQCVYFASVFNELVLYKHTFVNQTPLQRDQSKPLEENAN